MTKVFQFDVLGSWSISLKIEIMYLLLEMYQALSKLSFESSQTFSKPVARSLISQLVKYTFYLFTDESMESFYN